MLGKLTNNQSLGGIGLNTACLISGYLTAQSRASQQAAPYVVPRAPRILPAPYVVPRAPRILPAPLLAPP
ncbi:MAG: hypothetical protein ACYDDU_18310 [Dermatophilaceae bacterium]